MAVTIIDLVIIFAVAFVPAILYMLWIWSAEIHQREPTLAIEGVFLYGLVIALGLAFILETLAVDLLITATGGTLSIRAESIILAVILAPFIEEFTKLTGVFAVSRRLTEPENGLVYGAAVGLGFAAGENVLYYITALSAGTDIFIVTVIARTITSTLLHTSASAIAGFGLSRSRCMAKWYGTPTSWIPYYLIAVGLHAGFNFLAILGSDILPDASGEISFIALFLSVILVWTTVRWIRRKIIELDRQNAAGGRIQCQ
ncbi:MAG: PrsW family intramembrane metalloprotease [Methanomassiliicoccus sp.]|nr:PrsW family intramembrane metalloprotease [Methanomassiliicoccus sp.]